MFAEKKYDVIVAGGGLAGLICSIRLADKGKHVLMLEKNNYPFHKVCGEYVSNEVRPLLGEIGFDPAVSGASEIHKLVLSDVKGKVYSSGLSMGGFGISRFRMEEELFKIALQKRVEVHTNCRVESMLLDSNRFLVRTSSGEAEAEITVGSFGKRSSLDRDLNRAFLNQHTRFIGVKYHARLDFPHNTIALYSFPGGYCGVVKIEDDLFNICYLFRRGEKEKLSPSQIEEKYLFNNHHLKRIWAQLPSKLTPTVISEIYFGPKEKEKNNIIFCGDAAGLITPLCGNGMAIAIHSAKLLSDSVLQGGSLVSIRSRYIAEWEHNFSFRMKTGRVLQHLFLHPFFNQFVLRMMFAIPGAEKMVINRTHNREFVAS
jgi:menaquinone-9 beta-reductase